MIVADILSINPHHLDSTATVLDALELILEHDIRHVPVVNDGELIGIISDRDIRDFSLPLSEENYQPSSERANLKARVTEIMSADPITVDTETSLGDAIDIILEQKIGALPVVDEGTRTLRGIVSYEDLLRAARPFLSE
ncbi:MAG: CBS domain-containing protein [Bdellovibrionales bacterium]|nr:CBS domain-containing protein [Bdellovibrionales bacterium]